MELILGLLHTDLVRPAQFSVQAQTEPAMRRPGRDFRLGDFEPGSLP
jgi:hypothetical protein